jgi:hypothetical protein
MIQIVLHRSQSWVVACSDGMQWERGETSHGWLFKSGSEKPVHGFNPAVAESGVWCNDLAGRCHKGELP